jgi:hypothetical protein
MVTSDHRSVFSAWLGNRILGTRVEGVIVPDGSPAPDAGLAGSPDPGRLPVPTADGAAPGFASPSSAYSPSGPTAAPAGESPAGPSLSGAAFLLDPATGQVADLDAVRYIQPVVDPTGSWVVYWEGTLTPAANGLDWHPGNGRIVVAPWNLGDGAALFPITSDPGESPDPRESPFTPAASPESSAEPAAPGRPGDAGRSPEPRGNGGAADPSPGTDQGARAIQVLADGPLEDFDARFDPTGSYLAIWIGRGPSAVGRLSLFVLQDGRWTAGAAPGLVARPALRGFSIGDGQLAWVAPAADGTARHVQVVGWTADGIGSVVSAPGDSLIVIR